MKIVILTTKYPFSKSFDFLEKEIKYISKCYDEIIVFSESIKENNNIDIPINCKAYSTRKVKYCFVPLIIAFFKLFSIDVIKELFFAYKNLRYCNIIKNIKEIYIYKYHLILYKHLFKMFKFDIDNTVFYSYWLDHKAYFLAKMKQAGYIKFAISRAHGYDCYINRGYLPYRRQILNYLDIVIAASANGKNDIIKNLLKYIDKSDWPLMMYSYLGVEERALSTSGYKKDESFNVLTCSNIVDIKRLDILIDALSYLKSYKICWTHIGDGELQDKICKLAKDTLGSSNSSVKYRFLGKLTNNEVVNYYRNESVDVFINCSDGEGLPVSIMEAFYFGVPVIARDVGGIGEVLSEKNGLLLSKDIVPKQLADAIVRFINMDYQKFKCVKENAYQTYREKFNIKTNSIKLYTFINDYFKLV